MMSQKTLTLMLAVFCCRSQIPLAGPKVFGLARDLLSPQKPENTTLDVILETLKKHYKPKPLLIYERYKFYSRTQKSGESVKDFMAGLKALAHTCEFGATLSEMLRDRFVMGLASEKIQQVLLAESALTLDKALSMATAREAALKDVQAMASGIVHYVPTSQSGGKKSFGSSSKTHAANKSKPTNFDKTNASCSTTPKSPCSGCGKLHWKRDCPFKSATCHSCKQKGHIQKMCYRSKPGGKTQPKSQVNFTNCDDANNDDEAYSFVYSLTDNVSDEPMMVNVSLNDVRVPMEMDTGATCTLIPQSQYERFWPVSSERPILNASPITVNSYGGTPLKVVGEIDVSARLENGSSVDSTKVIIVDSRGPCVIGRVLMRQLGLIEDVNTVSATNKSMDSTPVPTEWHNLVHFLDSSPVSSADIKEHTRKGPTLSKVARFCELSWPTKTLNDSDLMPFIRRRDELSLQDG